jgi:hypothetical protein
VLYLTSSTTTVKKGSVVAVNVRIDPGTDIDTVTAAVTYNASQLSVKDVSYGGSPFATQLQEPDDVKPGSYGFTSVKLGGTPIATDSFVATVSFSVQASGGTVAIGLTGNAARSGTMTSPAARGINLTVGASTSACPVGQTGSSPYCHAVECPLGQTGTYPKCTPLESTSPTPTPTPTSKPAPPEDTTSSGASGNLKVSSVQIQYTVADMIITTQGKSRVYVRYGLSRDALRAQTKMSPLGTTHKIDFAAATILPGQTYFYQIIAKDSNGVVTKTKLDTFNTKGITVKVGTYDKNRKPLKHKTVTLHSAPQKTETDDRGFATFNNVAPGEHQLVYEAGGKTYTQSLVVTDNIQMVGAVQEADAQNFSIVYNLEQGNGLPSSIIGAVLAGLLAVVVVTVVVNRRRSGGLGFRSGSGPGGDELAYGPVTVGDVNRQTPDDSNVDSSSADTRSLSDRLDNLPPPPQSMPGTVISSNRDNNESEKRGL